jgi:hypothetical protein
MATAQNHMRAIHVRSVTFLRPFVAYGDNNVTLSFARNPENPSFDVPLAMLRIKQ